MRSRRPLVPAGLVVAALASALPASAHITFTPPFVTGGEEAEIAVSSPNERARAMTGLELEVPAGAELRGAAAPAGWTSEVDGRRAVWSGGTLVAGGTVRFRLQLRTRSEGETLIFQAVQRFQDGATVSWQPTLTVLPGTPPEDPEQYLGRALVAALAGVCVIGGSLVVLRRLRRRSLQER